MAKRGIDISAHQGNIDLGALKGQIDFVIIRVGYGTKGTIDNKFKRNADLCRSLGIPVGFYWYSEFTHREKTSRNFPVELFLGQVLWIAIYSTKTILFSSY